MKVRVLAQAISIAVALAAPAITFAQSNAPLTRAQVRAQLVQLEQAGYHVGDGDQATYPAQLQAAEAKVARAEAGSSGYGGAANGSSAAGAATPAAYQAEIPGLRPIYSGQ
jgi:hypothetical protein